MLHLIYLIVVLLAYSYPGHALRIVRDTSDIPTEKFKPIRSNDYDWQISQRSSSSVHGISEDNRQIRFEGPVFERGFGPQSSSFSYTAPEPHIGWLVVSSDSNTTLRYDSWEVTTPPSTTVKEDDELDEEENTLPTINKSLLRNHPTPIWDFPEPPFGSDRMLTAAEFRLWTLRRNPNHSLFSRKH